MSTKHAFLERLIHQIDTDKWKSEQTIAHIFEDKLFLGSQSLTTSEHYLRYKIMTVVSIGCDPIDKSNSNMLFYKFYIEDNGNKHNIETFFNDVIPKIHKIINICIKYNSPILIHCLAGMSRSAIVIITWLMVYQHMTYLEAFSYVKKARPVISPNLAFVDYINNH